VQDNIQIVIDNYYIKWIDSNSTTLAGGLIGCADGSLASIGESAPAYLDITAVGSNSYTLEVSDIGCGKVRSLDLTCLTGMTCPYNDGAQSLTLIRST